MVPGDTVDVFTEVIGITFHGPVIIMNGMEQKRTAEIYPLLTD